MGAIKYSDEALLAVSPVIENVTTSSGTCNTTAETFKTSAESTCSSWVNLVPTGIEKIPHYDDDGQLYNTTYKVTKYIDNVAEYDDPYDAQAAQTRYIESKQKKYVSYADKIVSITTNLTKKVNDDIAKIVKCLADITSAIGVFEETPVSLAEAIKSLENLNLAGDIAVEDNVLYYLDQDTGQKIKVAEMVNCFYTYTGSAMAGVVAAALKEGLTDSAGFVDIDTSVNNYLNGISNQTHTLLAKGCMSVASDSHIKDMFEEVAGKKIKDFMTDTDVLKELALQSAGFGKTYEELLTEETAAAAFPGAVLMAATATTMMGEDKVYSEENTKVAEERKDHQEKVATGEEEFVEKNPETGEVVENNEDLETFNETEEVVEPVEELEESEQGGGGGGGGSDRDRYDDSDYDDYNDNDTTESYTPETDPRLTQPVETVLPESSEVPKLSAEDIDTLAKEEFYDKYAEGELLADRRLNDNQEFDALFSSEDKSALIEKFKEMGYSETEAMAAANNKDVGLAAFMLGSQNAETAKIAQDLAKNMGFGEDFDTVYDDKPDYADLFDGDAAASLMDPSTNTAVAEAKDAFNTAKDAYTESVTEANESIQAANEAKTDLDAIKAKIISESGSDTSKWSDEQIKQYNEATRRYNTAVTKANEDVAESQAAKEAYNQAKVELKTKQEEYLEKIREAVREENGITGENSNSGNQAPNNEQTNSDPVIDSMSNEANKESTTDKIISDIVNNDQINNMIDGATNGGNNNNINKDNNVNTSGSTLDAINNIFSSM